MSTLFLAERNEDEEEADEDDDENDIDEVRGGPLILALLALFSALVASCVLFNMVSYRFEYFS